MAEGTGKRGGRGGKTGKASKSAPLGEAGKASDNRARGAAGSGSVTPAESAGKKPGSSKGKKAKSKTKKGKGKNVARLMVRPLRPEDYPAMAAIQRACFPGLEPWSERQFKGQIHSFPEGQIGIELDGELVATSNSLVIDRKTLPPRHTFQQACGDGYLGNHDPSGDTLYGVDIAVSPKHRGKRMARRLYDERKALCVDLNLRSMLIGGRMPGYHKHADKLTPEQYVARVGKRRLRDPVIDAQTANGFQICHVLRDYLPGDVESHEHAVLMEWINPDYVPLRPGRTRVIDDVRVAAVQYQMRAVASFEEFAKQCEFFVDAASDYRGDFVCFPELLTTQLLSLVEPGTAAQAARELSRFSADYERLFGDLALRYNINIVAGTHLVVDGPNLYNEAVLFRRDGSVERQRKIHVTPGEERWWGVSAGDEVAVFDTDCGPVGILICYDVEFPELARTLTAMGARLLFVPFNTDIRSGYLRVRSCAQARCIENNVYLVLAGACGNLPQVEGADIHYAQSAILTPSDIIFARDGIGAEATPNVETLLVHELDMSLLRWNQANGAVRTWLDRRHDLYQIQWRGRPIDELERTGGGARAAVRRV